MFLSLQDKIMRRRRAMGILKRILAIREAKLRGKPIGSITMREEIDRKLLWRKRTVSADKG